MRRHSQSKAEELDNGLDVNLTFLGDLTGDREPVLLPGEGNLDPLGDLTPCAATRIIAC